MLRFGRIELPTRPSIPASAPVGSEPFSREWPAALQGKEGADLPAAKELAADTLCVHSPWQFPNEVAGQSVRPIVSGAPLFAIEVERVLCDGYFAG